MQTVQQKLLPMHTLLYLNSKFLLPFNLSLNDLIVTGEKKYPMGSKLAFHKITIISTVELLIRSNSVNNQPVL